MLFDEIEDHYVGDTENIQQDAFIISKNGVKRQRGATKYWEILIQWKDGSTTWESIKDAK